MSYSLSDARIERRDKIFVRNITGLDEESITQLFKRFGPVVECYIPKNKITGSKKDFCFITFSTDTVTHKAIKDTDGTTYMGRTLRVSYAVESERHKEMRTYYGSHRYEKSRSRSPQRKTHNFTEGELEEQISELSRRNYDLKQSIIKLVQEYEDLQGKYAEFKKENEDLRREADITKLHNATELPCGHKKLLRRGEQNLLEMTTREALNRLTPEQHEDSNLTHLVRLRVFHMLERKISSLKCTQREHVVIGRCGHIANEECFWIRSHLAGNRGVQCKEIIHGSCMHRPKIECYREYETDPCSICSRTL